MGRKLFTLFLIITMIFTSFNIIAVSNENQIPDQNIELEKQLMDNMGNEIIIKFKQGFNSKRSVDSLSNYSSLGNNFKELDSLTKLVSVESSDIEETIQLLEDDPGIEYVERNYIYKQTRIPNDTYYNSLWHLGNIKAERAWNQINENGNSAVVAVIDSGIDHSHIDLRNRIAPGGYNFLHNSTDIYDYDGHGTFISGVISAEANNNYGITGIAGNNNIKILPLRVSDYEGMSSVSNIIRAIDYSISKDVDVINLSLGGTDYSHSLKDAIQRAIKANIVVVAASGNEALLGNPIIYPASYNGVISVGATDMNNNRAEFSNYNNYVDIVAPGQFIYSTYPYSTFDYGSGTSYSTPMVSATAALLRSIDPMLNVGEITKLLTTTAKDLGRIGKDPHYGYGLLNMEEAVKSVLKTPVSGVTKDYKDYQSMNVHSSKIFKIEFNYDIDVNSLNDNIFMSSDEKGETINYNYDLNIDINNNKIVYVRPLDNWTKGYNYLFINDKIMSVDGKIHKEKLRIRIFVE